MSKDYSAVLYNVLEETLENLAFMFAEEVDINELSMNDTECVQVYMGFKGDLFNGSLMMILPNNISNELAANILGIDETSEDAGNLGKDSLKEVLNVICGRVLTEIAGEDPLFNLAIPELKIIENFDIENFVGQDNTSCAIIDDMYPIILKYEQD